MKILLKNGTVIDPHNNLEGIYDVLISGDRIEMVSKNISVPVDQTFDLTNLWVIPGIIDMHVHLRDPGQTHKEDILTGTQAAINGGITSVCCMANTNPVNDNLFVMNYILEKSKKSGFANVFPVAAITKGLLGKELTDFGTLKQAGAVALSDDGHYLSDSKLLSDALKYAAQFNLPIISHAEDPAFIHGGMNEGIYATTMGIPGIPNESESAAVAKDIEILHGAGGHLHIAHISTARTLTHINRAKLDGLNVTCEVTPHHFTLTDPTLKNYNTNAKMNPPLRSERDKDKILEGLADGSIDAIATDHAPHTQEEKNVDFIHAPNGIIGLETSVGLTLTELYHKKIINKKRFVELVSYNPAKILQLNRGTLSENTIADITIIDPHVEWVIREKDFKSKSQNTPFIDYKLTGKAVGTMVNGKGFGVLAPNLNTLKQTI